MIAFAEALAFQTTIGRAAIEKRARALAQQLMAGLSKIDGFKVWTHPAPERSAAVVSFLPGTLDTRKLLAALYEKDRIAVTSRGGADRGGLRVSPHFYNTPAGSRPPARRAHPLRAPGHLARNEERRTKDEGRVLRSFVLPTAFRRRAPSGT